MSFPPQASSGRRGNGLAAAEWGALVDLDPRLSDGLLDSLAAAGVPAYVEPAGGRMDPTGRAVELPKRPLDRLWVDPTRADRARDVVAAELADLTALLHETEPGATAHGLVAAVPAGGAPRVLAPPALPPRPVEAARPDATPPDVVSPVVDAAPSDNARPPAAPVARAGPSGEEEPATVAPSAEAPPGREGPHTAPEVAVPHDEDEVFRRIVAGWDSDQAGPIPVWPVSEDLDAPPRPGGPQGPAAAGAGVAGSGTAGPGADGELPGWLEPAALDDDGHYVPPPPPAPPRPQRRTIGAGTCVLLGLLMMFAPGLLTLPATFGVGMLGVVLLAGGAGALVWWMRDAPPTDRGPDDGAVV